MKWLVLTENENKAAAFRKVGPQVIAISTAGLAWDCEVITSATGEHLSYDKGRAPRTVKTNSALSAIPIIEETALDVDRVLLAFDPTSLGEACAVEFESLIGKERCARWPSPSLDTIEIKKELTRLEYLPPHELPQTKKGRAENYWVQRTIDIIWTQRINLWVEQKTLKKARITRLMAALLKIINDDARDLEVYATQKYWELKCRVKQAEEEHSPNITALAVVPLYQISETTPETRKYWHKKLQEARTAAINGRGLPQPEPGFPWRYESLEAAASQKTYLEMFPYFGIEKTIPSQKKEARRPPLTYTSIIELAEATKKGTAAETDSALLDLYYMGWISHPKTTNPNLSKKTFEALLEHAVEAGKAVNPELQNFGSPMESSRWVEAIRPTRWDRTPEKATSLMEEPHPRTKAADPGYRARKLWLYRMIYNRAMESQLEIKEEPINRCFLMGPVPIKKSEGHHYTGNASSAKETRLSAHKSVMLAMELGEVPPDKKTAYECKSVEIIERSTVGPQPMTEGNIIKKMMEEGLGKRETLLHHFDLFRKNGWLENTPTVKLTSAGKNLYIMLNNHFGLFLEKDYHTQVSDALANIEAGKADATDFLQEWWECFRSYL